MLFIIIMFFISLLVVYAKEDLVIENIEINNALISPKYDKYNNYYSVTLNEDITQLDFNIKYDESNTKVEIDDNNNLVNNKLVYVTIYDLETNEKNVYIFQIYKEDATNVINEVNENKELEVKDEENEMLAPIIGTICFVIILLVYYIMFLR